MGETDLDNNLAKTFHSSDKGKQQPRGFSLMTPERRREIAALGGKTAHVLGKARQWNSETAQEAGRLGGLKVSQDREHMREIGRKGQAGRMATIEARRKALLAEEGQGTIPESTEA